MKHFLLKPLVSLIYTVQSILQLSGFCLTAAQFAYNHQGAHYDSSSEYCFMGMNLEVYDTLTLYILLHLTVLKIAVHLIT